MPLRLRFPAADITPPIQALRARFTRVCAAIDKQLFTVAIQAIPAITTLSSEIVRKPSLYNAGYILSGKRMINPSRFGIRTFGSVFASIASFSPISLFDAKM
jgi:hypothetical protein